MPKINTDPISGVLELLPSQQLKFTEWKSKALLLAKDRDFVEIETPMLERLDFLFAKENGETTKQIYQVLKTGEKTPPKQGLRFDNTVPLMRYILAHENGLTFPFRAFQLNKCFRGERAQRGRFREFYQADYDIIKRTRLSTADDAIVIDTIGRLVCTLACKDADIHISNRKILAGVIEWLRLKEQEGVILNLIDHADKIGREKMARRLVETVGEENAEVINKVVFSMGMPILSIDNATYKKGVEELKEVMVELENLRTTAPCNYKVIPDMSIVRGLDYYTGTVFETKLKDYEEIGSVGSGGRYDDMSKIYSNRTFSGTGGAVGLTRLFAAIQIGREQPL